MALSVTAIRSRYNNLIEISFSEALQAVDSDLLATAADPRYFSVMVDGRQRRISQVTIEGGSTVVLTVPGRALSQAIELTLDYTQPDVSTSSGWLADSSGQPLGSLATRAIATLVSPVASTKAMGAAYLDLVLTGDKPIRAIGNAHANTITGNGAANVIDGGAGADRMIGGRGNDTYWVDDVGDVVIEQANEGQDAIMASLSWQLPDHVELLTLTGRDPLNGTGNDLDNTLTGNTAANVLDGGSGEDLLIGGKGNDTYVVNSLGDRIREAGLEADIDTVRASISWTLGAKLEDLVLTGLQAIDGTGNERNNRITGNGAANVLDGGRDGIDVLTGLGGADTFRFGLRPTKFSDFHADRITDFDAAQGDRIAINRAAFGLKASATTTLAVVALDAQDDRKATDEALGTPALFVYNRTRGELHWNQNGTARGPGSGGIIAVFETKPLLTATDIVLI
jgi:Ca2+-binding RTX toxin-like protein